MKALSIVAPHGQNIASGKKTLEIRSWIPPYINEDILIVENDHYLFHEGEVDPHGRAVAIVKVKSFRPYTRDDIEAACATSWSEGYYAWELAEVRPLTCETTVVAKRRIYEVDSPLS